MYRIIFKFLLTLVISFIALSYFSAYSQPASSEQQKKTNETRSKLAKLRGKELVFVLHIGKIAKGILVSMDEQNIYIKNKHGEFPIPIGAIKEILIVKKDPIKKPVLPPPAETEQPANPMLPPPEILAQNEPPPLAKYKFHAGSYYVHTANSFVNDIMEYPLPGSSNKVDPHLFGLLGGIEFYFDHTKNLFFTSEFNYHQTASKLHINNSQPLLLESTEASGYRVDFEFFFTYLLENDLFYLNNLWLTLLWPEYNQNNIAWMRHSVPYYSFGLAGSFDNFSAGSNFGSVNIIKDQWNLALRTGIKNTHFYILPGLTSHMEYGFFYGMGYVGINADATDYYSTKHRVQSGISYQFLSNFETSLTYRYEYEGLTYRKSILSTPAYKPGTSQEFHRIFLYFTLIIY